MNKDTTILNLEQIKRELSEKFAEKSQLIEFLSQQLMSIAQTQTQQQSTDDEWITDWLQNANASE